MSFRLLLFSFFHIMISFHLSILRHICLIFTLTCTLRCTVKNHSGSPPVWVDLLICEMGWKCEWGARRRRTVIYEWRQFYMEMGGKECDPEAWCPSPLQWSCMIEPHKCQTSSHCLPVSSFLWTSLKCWLHMCHVEVCMLLPCQRHVAKGTVGGWSPAL